MRFIRIKIPNETLHLYPLVCWHIGAKQSCFKLIQTVIAEIKKDPLARWIYMGDLGECVTKNSKGNIYEQLISPGDQLREGVDWLWPIRDKGLFGIRGNHGNRIDKETGVGWDELFCARIGVPYLGVSAMADIVLHGKAKNSLKARKHISVYTHHGSSSSIAAGGKVTAAHKPEAFVMADLILTAHTHAAGWAPPDRIYAYTDGRENDVQWGMSRAFMCGSAYDSRRGYAEEKMYPPLLPQHMVFKLTHKRTSRPDYGADRRLPSIEYKRIYLDPRDDKIVIEGFNQ